MSGQGERLAIPVPKQLRTNERDPRGYPIPFIVLRDKMGRPHFTVNDAVKVARCVSKRLCGLCGKRMGEQVHFIGGRRCFTDPRGAFVDPPSHRDCAVYALRVCPFLAAPSYGRRIDGRTIAAGAVPEATALVMNQEMAADRPDFFGLGAAADYRLMPVAPGTAYLVVDRWAAIEYWRHGRPV